MSLNKKSVDDINVKGKRVLCRCDFNVPLKNGEITDENRLVAALPTIKKLIADGGKVILCSHLGKVKTEEDKQTKTLAPVAKRLTELLGQEVKFVPSLEVVDDTVKAAVDAMKDGDVLLDYSMDSTIYFPTLEQYRCNPAMVISGNVNDKVFAMATGKITDIQENEETGCTVIQDLGDGYAAVYGQLKELNFAKGDTPEAGQVLGYVSEPTKYYTTEGSNVYFQLKKDGKAVDPKEYLPQMAMDTLD